MKKVLVGMSGGIDSSVAACLLKEQGFEVLGVHLRFWSEPGSENKIHRIENKCCSIESWELAAEVAKKIGIQFKVIDLAEEFKEKIVDYYLEESSRYLTPNPCVECNRYIKFGKFLEATADLNADFIATGHYIKKHTIVNPDGSETYKLYEAEDHQKDQSYFLYTLTQEKLKKVLFPLGDYQKSEVRELAVKYGIDFMRKKKESQNLCFIPEKESYHFLQRNLDEKYFQKGPIITVTGQEIGVHEGLPRYTIGQRKGIGIGGISGNTNAEPWFVVGFDQSKNALIVGHEAELHTKNVSLRKVTFTNEPISGQIKTKIRYRSLSKEAILDNVDLINKTANLTFDIPERAVTPGQSAVFFINNELCGGGVIDKILDQRPSTKE